VIPFVAFILFLYNKRKDNHKKLKGFSSILDGIIGGIIASWIYSLRSFSFIFQITGFLFVTLIIILRIYYTEKD